MVKLRRSLQRRAKSYIPSGRFPDEKLFTTSCSLRSPHGRVVVPVITGSESGQYRMRTVQRAVDGRSRSSSASMTRSTACSTFLRRTRGSERPARKLQPHVSFPRSECNSRRCFVDRLTVGSLRSSRIVSGSWHCCNCSRSWSVTELAKRCTQIFSSAVRGATLLRLRPPQRRRNSCREPNPT